MTKSSVRIILLKNIQAGFAAFLRKKNVRFLCSLQETKDYIVVTFVTNLFQLPVFYNV